MSGLLTFLRGPMHPVGCGLTQVKVSDSGNC